MEKTQEGKHCVSTCLKMKKNEDYFFLMELPRYFLTGYSNKGEDSIVEIRAGKSPHLPSPVGFLFIHSKNIDFQPMIHRCFGGIHKLTDRELYFHYLLVGEDRLHKTNIMIRVILRYIK